MKRRQPFIVLILASLMLIVAACGGEDENDNGEPPRPTNTSDVAEVVFTPSPEGEGTLSPTPTTPLLPTPLPLALFTPSATFNYPLERYIGDWTLLLRLEVTGNPFADLFRYSGNAQLFVDFDGNISGSGSLFAFALDDQCSYTPLDYDSGYTFKISGAMRYDGTVIWMDLRIEPDNYQMVESYNRVCQDFTLSGAFQQIQVWLTLGETGRLSHSIPMNQSYPPRLTFSENLTERTGGFLLGSLNAEMQLIQ